MSVKSVIVLIVGPTACGKSTLVERFLNKHFYSSSKAKVSADVVIVGDYNPEDTLFMKGLDRTLFYPEYREKMASALGCKNARISVYRAILETAKISDGITIMEGATIPSSTTINTLKDIRDVAVFVCPIMESSSVMLKRIEERRRNRKYPSTKTLWRQSVDKVSNFVMKAKELDWCIFPIKQATVNSRIERLEYILEQTGMWRPA